MSESLPVWVTFIFIFSAAFGEAFGFGVILIYMRQESARRERELENKIKALETKFDNWIDYLVQTGQMTQRAADKAKRSTGPLAGRDMIIGGDFAGRDKAENE